MAKDDEDFPLSYLFYVIAAMAAVLFIVAAGVLIWLR
jgi:hypothetical protein